MEGRPLLNCGNLYRTPHRVHLFHRHSAVTHQCGRIRETGCDRGTATNTKATPQLSFDGTAKADKRGAERSFLSLDEKRDL